jgi:hypothetical protein
MDISQPPDSVPFLVGALVEQVVTRGATHCAEVPGNGLKALVL